MIGALLFVLFVAPAPGSWSCAVVGSGHAREYACTTAAGTAVPVDPRWFKAYCYAADNYADGAAAHCYSEPQAAAAGAPHAKPAGFWHHAAGVAGYVGVGVLLAIVILNGGAGWFVG